MRRSLAVCLSRQTGARLGAAAAAAATPEAAPEGMRPSQFTLASSAAHTRALPFDWAFDTFVERGGLAGAEKLVNHPQAPTPEDLLVSLMKHVTPSPQLMVSLLVTALRNATSQQKALTDGKSSSASTKAKKKGSKAANEEETAVFASPMVMAHAVSSSPLLARDVDVVNLLVRYLVAKGYAEHATSWARTLEGPEVQRTTWSVLVRSARTPAIQDLTFIAWLVHPTRFPNSAFTLPADAAADLMARSKGPVVACHILDRYVAHIDRQRTAKLKTLPLDKHHTVDKFFPLHPTPFLVFFGTVAASRHPEHKYTMLHWELSWGYFQLLNKRNPTWYKEITPAEAEHLCKFVLTSIVYGAKPFMTLNVARAMAKRHLVDPVDITLWSLHRLSPTHYPEQARGIAKMLFKWLTDTVGIHAHPRYQHSVVPAARVLISLGMIEELRELHTLVIEHLPSVIAASMNVKTNSGKTALKATIDFRDRFVTVFADLVCDKCNSLLDEQDITVERTCRVCLAKTPAKATTAIPSFQMDNRQREVAKQRATTQRDEARQMLKASVTSLRKNPKAQRKSTTVSQASQKDALEVLKEHLIDGEGPLVPGVSSSKDASSGGLLASGKTATAESISLSFDLASKRLDLQLKAREHILRSRAENLLGDEAPIVTALPSTALPPPVSTSRKESRASRKSVPPVVADVTVSWRCPWCHEENTETASRTHCSACGAETGPMAAWRQFAFSKKHDVLEEIRARINHGMHEAGHGAVAAYYLMVFRKTFLLRAKPEDYALLDKLVSVLARDEERVLGAYILMRVVPAAQRSINKGVRALAALFDQPRVNLPKKFWSNEEKFFKAVFGEETCKVCYGTHEWQRCPIITRDFKHGEDDGRIARDAAKAQFSRIVRLVKMVEDGKLPAIDAYRAFVTSNHREEVAAQHPDEINTLSIRLSGADQYRRAAFVLCHIPLHLRSNASYFSVVPYFGVTHEECASVIENREVGKSSAVHPNFVQVASTCCMCLDDRHASFQCPRLKEWFEAACGVTQASTTGSLVSSEQHYLLQKLRAQANGWCNSGPERLFTFHRFFTHALEDESMIPVGALVPGMPLADALNACIMKVAAGPEPHLAFRLFAITPRSALNTAAILSLMRLAELDDVTIARFEQRSQPTAPYWDDAWPQMIIPKNLCLCCFKPGHGFTDCPTLVHLPHVRQIAHIANTVGAMRINSTGTAAAADHLQFLYTSCRLTSEMLRTNPELTKAVLQVARRCFAWRMPQRGFLLVRRIPVQMVPVNTYEALWKASGMTNESVAHHATKLAELYDTFDLKPDVYAGSKREFAKSPEFLRPFSAIVAGSLCRHCYTYGHQAINCDVFHGEASFGRDIIAVFRVTVCSESFKPEESHLMLLRMMHFVLMHSRQLPFQILGVQRACNALASIAAMSKEPGIALRLLLAIPASHRMRHVFQHILFAFGIPKEEAMSKLHGFLVTGDTTAQSGDRDGMGDTAGDVSLRLNPDHLLNYRTPIPDVAMDALFADVKGAPTGLAEADARIISILTESSPAGAAAVNAAKAISSETGRMRIPSVQQIDITELREAFDPIQRDVEEVVGQQLGSRHRIFASSIEVLDEHGNPSE